MSAGEKRFSVAAEGECPSSADCLIGTDVIPRTGTSSFVHG